MCGIAGYFSRSNEYNEETLHFFTKIQHHRGPDAQGVFSENQVGLAHNRLSILDTSSNANQPFHSQCKRYVMVFNGEVYNFRELAHKYSINTKTTSDTEVILECFVKFGPSCVVEFRGMFAIAIYDRIEKSLHLMRDRFGIKPLYYYQDNETFLFSSESKAICELPQIKHKLTINQEAIHHFLYLGFIPEEHTIYNQVKKFPSANYGHCTIDNKLHLKKYWSAENQLNKIELSYSDAKKKLEELLYSSVKEHLISDVPVGIFLSGGIDSSLLATIANEISPDKIQSFTVGFDNNTKNEAPFARAIAKHIGIKHQEIYLKTNDTIRLYHKLKETYDEPFADTSAIPTLLISELASKHVKVVLSGEGSDELFMGYGSHMWAKRVDNWFIKYTLFTLYPFHLLISNKFLSKSLNLISMVGTPFEAANIYNIEHGFFNNSEISALTQKSKQKRYAFEKFHDDLTNQILFELEVSLKDGLLVKMDRATMQYGLEARVPFLDNRLVDFSLGIQNQYKLKNGISKRILKDILFDKMPKKLLNRPKWGFGISNSSALDAVLGNQEMSFQKRFTLSQLKGFVS